MYKNLILINCSKKFYISVTYKNSITYKNNQYKFLYVTMYDIDFAI